MRVLCVLLSISCTIKYLTILLECLTVLLESNDLNLSDKAIPLRHLDS